MTLTGEPARSVGPDARPVSAVPSIFVAMSLREHVEPALADYYQAMLRAAARARRPFSVVRVDEIDGDYEIVDRTYREIDAATVMIADLTLSSPSVYLEIGYAMGRDKQVILTCRSDTAPEFDVRGRKILFYPNATTLEAKLLRALDALYGGL